MLKYRARRDHKPSFARAAHQLNGDDAVAPKCKEVVVDPNTLDTQNLRKQPAQQLLLRRARHTPKPSTKLRPRQRRTVKLPVRRQRKSIQNNYRCRHHVVGKPRTNMRAQLIRLRITTRSQNDIANKLDAPRTSRARYNRRLRYAPMPQKRRLDLPRLNAKTADLNLLVRAPHKLQCAIPAPARQVPAAVHPTPRSTKPIRNQALPSQTHATQITTRHTRSRNVKLPNNPNRNRLQTTIQNVYTRVPYRPPNRNTRLNVIDLSRAIRGRPDATLSRAILINQRHFWEKLVMTDCQIGWACFTGNDNRLQL